MNNMNDIKNTYCYHGFGLFLRQFKQCFWQIEKISYEYLTRRVSPFTRVNIPTCHA